MYATEKRKGKNGKRKTNAVTRPTLYTKRIVSKILDRLIQGESLVKICRDKNMPSTATIYNWLRSDSEFLKEYQLVRKFQIDMLCDQLITIPDEYESVARGRLMSQNIKWLLPKIGLKKYKSNLSSADDQRRPRTIEVEFINPKEGGLSNS